MQPITVNAGGFSQRIDLDNYIRNEIGDNIDSNRTAGHVIQGTADELKVLQLSINNRVYGVKVVQI